MRCGTVLHVGDVHEGIEVRPTSCRRERDANTKLSRQKRLQPYLGGTR